MKRLLAAALLGCVAFGADALAQAEIARATMPAPPQPGVIALQVAGCDPASEVWHPDGGKPAVRNVTCPTLLPFLPKAASRVLEVGCAGGAFSHAMKQRFNARASSGCSPRPATN